MDKNFKAYPIRQIRMSDEVWEEFKLNKEKSAETWNNYIKELLNKNGLLQSKDKSSR